MKRSQAHFAFTMVKENDKKGAQANRSRTGSAKNIAI